MDRSSELNWGDLPLEMQLHLLSFLPPEEQKRVESVCKAWQQAFNHPMLKKALDRKRTSPISEELYGIYSIETLHPEARDSHARLAIPPRKPGDTWKEKQADVLALEELGPQLVRVIERALLPKEICEKARFLLDLPSTLEREWEFRVFKAEYAKRHSTSAWESMCHLLHNAVWRIVASSIRP